MVRHITKAMMGEKTLCPASALRRPTEQMV
jgi:hypothetical protein